MGLGGLWRNQLDIREIFIDFVPGCISLQNGDHCRYRLGPDLRQISLKLRMYCKGQLLMGRIKTGINIFLLPAMELSLLLV